MCMSSTFQQKSSLSFLYVDDMLIVGLDPKLIHNLKNEISKFFDIKDLGAARQILGIQTIRDRRAKNLWVSQENIHRVRTEEI